MPRLGLRREGFRGVWPQVEKRVVRRVHQLGLDELAEYRALLERDPAEWRVLDAACRITISRFRRDRATFDELEANALPELAERARRSKRPNVRALSVGCARGEEAYSLVMSWSAAVAPAFPDVRLEVVALDSDPAQVARARTAVYDDGALAEVPDELARAAFEGDGRRRLVPRLRAPVDFVVADVRDWLPDGPFDLVLCRNLVLTYFDAVTRDRVLARIVERMAPAGFLVIGKRERLPELAFEEPSPGTHVFRRKQ